MGEHVKFNEGDDLNTIALPKLSKYENLRITDCTELAAAEPVITINGESVGSNENIVTVSGAVKSGKSAFTSCIIAGAVSEDGNLVDGLDGLVVTPNTDRKAVIHIDTEQAKHKQQANVRTILQRAGYATCPDYFRSYNIRELDLSEYQKVTSEICQAAYREYGGIKMIIIDGIADYIKSVNNEEESIAIVNYFMKLAAELNTVIVAVVHTNPGSEKERGHLGSQCLRKSESILTVKCTNGVSHLEAKFLRNAGVTDIPQLQFAFDKEKGYHVGCGVRTKTKEDKEEERKHMLEELALEIYALQAAYAYKDAIAKIEEVSGKKVITAKGYFKEMKESGLITQGEDNLWRLGDAAS